MRIFLSFMLALLGFPISAMAAAQTGAPTGYYVGMGDGAVIVFHALPDGKAALGAVETSTGGGWRPTPPSPTAVMGAAQVKHGAYIGTLSKVAPGHYRFVLGTPAHKISYCIHSVTMTHDGGVVLQQPKFQTGCMNYHGASWGFSAPLKTPLRPYKIRK